MIIKYTTKRDINGNRKTLIVNTDMQTYKRDYNTSYDYTDYITISVKDRNKIMQQLDEAGYISI